MFVRNLLAIAAILVLAAGLSACGRKGALEAPPKATAGAPTGDQQAAPDGSEDENKGGANGTGKPERPFILDGLLS